MNIELYIANQLCDLEKSDLSIRLKRQFINPTQLNSKDSQKSYTLSLPSTPNNDAIFRYKNVEETDGKFSLYPDSRLYVNGTLIMDGKFRLTSITRKGYKGNLGQPYIQSVKDVFGEQKMNETGEWVLPNWKVGNEVKAFDLISQINKKEGISDYFFPLAMYGLLPKEDTLGEGYSAKDVFDHQAKIRFEDMPPSFNCLRLMKRFFENKNCTLTGTAFDDERLKNLYVSYRNNKEAQMDWSTGAIEYKLKNWQVYAGDNHSSYGNLRIEKNIYSMPEVDKKLMYINLFDLNNTNHGIGSLNIKDPYNNVKKTNSGNKIVIPHSGLYKVELKCWVKLIKDRIPTYGSYTYHEIPDYDPINPQSTNKLIIHSIRDNTFIRVPIEIMLLKNRDEDYKKYQFINRYYRNNTPFEPGNRDNEVLFPKEKTIDKETDEDKEDLALANDSVDYKKKGYPHFIDPLTSKNLVCGFSFGRKTAIYDGDSPEEIIPKAQTEKLSATNTTRAYSDRPEDDISFSSPNDKYYLHPYSQGYCFPMLPLGGYSWSAGYKKGTNDRNYSVVNSPSYTTASNKIPPKEKYKIDLYKGNSGIDPTRTFAMVDTTTVSYDTVDSSKFRGGREAFGNIEQVVWLEKGDVLEMIELILTGNSSILNGNNKLKQIVFNHSVSFDLKITPFKKDKSWFKMNDIGSGTEPMYWDDKSDFSDDKLNLTNFLPSNVKINDWVDNFCKAFNLQLNQVGDKKYSLDLKENSLNRSSSILLDLDQKASVEQRTNEPLNLPKTYNIGFTIDQKEEGYVRSKKYDEQEEKDVYEDGGGTFDTGSLDNNVTSQKSTFSYNWMKPMRAGNNSQEVVFELPVISDSEAWERSFDYREMMKKKYYDKAQRFWYKKGIKKIDSDYKNANTNETIKIDTALVGNHFEGEKSLYLNYLDKPNSIMREYFMLLNNNKNYTVVECYLTPEEYNDLDKCYVKFNGDLYLVAEADGFDPMERNKTKLKLLRKS